MIVCTAFRNGVVCRLRARRQSSAIVGGDDGQPCLVRTVICPMCGPRRQVIRDEGAAPKIRVTGERKEHPHGRVPVLRKAHARSTRKRKGAKAS